MEFNNFVVSIVEGKETKDGYVELPHKTRYTLRLGNRTNGRCDAHVSIDGKLIGIWRIEANDGIRLERPVHDTGHFTFYALDSAEAKRAGLQLNDQLGLVSVTFVPEKVKVVRRDSISAEDTLDLPAFLRRRVGGTGLSGHSNQTFTNAKDIVLDEEAKVTIHLRLVEADDTTPRPLKGMSLQTPVPPLPKW